MFCNNKGTVILPCTESLPHRRALPEKLKTLILATPKGHLEPGLGTQEDKGFLLAGSHPLLTFRLTAQ